MNVAKTMAETAKQINHFEEVDLVFGGGLSPAALVGFTRLDLLYLAIIIYAALGLGTLGLIQLQPVLDLHGKLPLTAGPCQSESFL